MLIIYKNSIINMGEKMKIKKIIFILILIISTISLTISVVNVIKLSKS